MTAQPDIPPNMVKAFEHLDVTIGERHDIEPNPAYIALAHDVAQYHVALLRGGHFTEHQAFELARDMMYRLTMQLPGDPEG